MSDRKPDKIQALNILRAREIPVGTVVDVGVCHGTPELMTVWGDRKHVLFEPVREFADNIKRAYIGIPHELYCMAVGEEPGSVGLTVASVLPGMEISHSSMTNAAHPDGRLVRTIPRISLDSFLPNLNLEEPYLLKIDIDGYELQVIKGAVETLKKCSIVIVECQALQLAQRIEAIQKAGFTLFDLCEPCYYDKAFWQCDAVFVRNDFALSRFKQLTGAVEPGMYECFRSK